MTSRKLIVLALAALAIITMPGAAWAQGKFTGPVRVPSGFRIAPPGGWWLRELRNDAIAFQSGDTIVTVNQFDERPYEMRFAGAPIYNLSNGAAVYWAEYSMAELHGEAPGNRDMSQRYIVMNGVYLGVNDSELEEFVGRLEDEPALSRSRFQEILRELAQSLQLVPRTSLLIHPTKGFAVAVLPNELAYWTATTESAIEVDLHYNPKAGGHVKIRVSPHRRANPEWIAQASAAAILEGLTEDYRRQGITFTAPQRLELPSGAAAWAAAPGTTRPYLGVVFRGRWYFKVEAEAEKVISDPSLIWDEFQRVLASVRPSARQ